MGDEPEPLPSEPPPQATSRRRRGAVSAAVISEEDAASYVKKVNNGCFCKGWFSLVIFECLTVSSANIFECLSHIKMYLVLFTLNVKWMTKT